MGISVLCGYVAIRFHGLTALSVAWTGLNVTIILAAYVTALGNINSSSKNSIEIIRKQPAVLQRMRKYAERKWLQKEVLCLQDLRISMGSVYFYDSGLFVTTFEIIFENTVNLLLLYWVRWQLIVDVLGCGRDAHAWVKTIN